jgi:hypothetical protein
MSGKTGQHRRLLVAPNTVIATTIVFIAIIVAEPAVRNRQHVHCWPMFMSNKSVEADLHVEWRSNVLRMQGGINQDTEYVL